MDRVKSLKEVILTEHQVLMEFVEEKTKGGLITGLDGKNLSKEESRSYGVVVAVGTAVIDLEPGYIIIKTDAVNSPGFKYDNKDYVLISRHNIRIATTPNNFTTTNEISA